MAVVAIKKGISPHTSIALDSRQALERRLASHGLWGTPLDVEQAAEFLGLEISREIMDKDISGYLERRGNHWIIGVNSLHHRTRQRFTIAHEIAHFVLHGGMDARFRDVTFARRNLDADPKERDADNFAAELLMPEQALRDAIASGRTSLQDLARLFDVSPLAMKFRVRELGYNVR